MSSSHTLCCFPSVKNQKHDFHFFSFSVKQLLDEVFVISTENNQGLGKGYQPQPSASADNLSTFQ